MHPGPILRSGGLVVVGLVIVLIAPAARAGDAVAAPGLGEYAPFGLDLAGTDRRGRPGDDFFRYGNGGWLARTPLPPDRAIVGIDQGLEADAQARIRRILEGADAASGTDLGKARDLYRAFLDEAGVEARGVEPLRDALGAIRAAASREDIAALMGSAKGGLAGALFDLAIRPDAKAPDRYAVTIRQGGLGLPDRSYYAGPDFAPARDGYRAYMMRALDLAGWPAPDAAADAVVAFEAAIAAASWPASETRDVERTYNPTDVADLAASSPFPWRRFLAAAGLGQVERVIVAENDAVAALGVLFDRTPVPVLQAWHAFHLVDAAAPYLAVPFVEAHDAFRSRLLEGTTETLPRWRRGIDLVERLMGEALGRAYVEDSVPAATKPAVEAMVETLRAAFAARIDGLAWMSPDTKARAHEKLARLGRKVAYPDSWRSYAGLEIRPDDLLGDVRAGRAFAWARRVARIRGPVVRGEWFMTPQTADAAYSVSLNELVLPAAELQAPFFHPQADAAVNYGGIGAIIGHEMTHGFDDQGRKFDAIGRLSAWWRAEDSLAFTRVADRLAAQLGRTEALPGLFVDGRLTLSEAIADLGGAEIALDAYHRTLGGREAPVIDGLTGDQRFFLAYAQAWRWTAREPALRRRLAADPHAPPAVRVNGTLRNMDAWYAAFDVQPGDALYLPPDARIRLW